ncbi:sensor histidine kinase [Marinicellulosiphila megalodicopiae]|uniref:sensor histidine kinase n=1 Tax=Marinicellulosiphila megalodicopiae TaxID=2724896 RepID=UPI003BAF48AF
MLLLAAIGVLAFTMLSQRQQQHFLQKQTLIMVEQIQGYFAAKYKDKVLVGNVSDSLSNELLVLQHSFGMHISPSKKQTGINSSFLMIVKPNNVIDVWFDVLLNNQKQAVKWRYSYTQHQWITQLSELISAQFQLETFDSQNQLFNWVAQYPSNDQLMISLKPFDSNQLTEHQINQMLMQLPVFEMGDANNQNIVVYKRLDNHWVLTIEMPVYLGRQSIEILLYTLAMVMFVGLFVCILFIRPIESKIARLLKSLDKFESAKDEPLLPMQLEAMHKPEDEIAQISNKVSQMMQRMHQLAKDQQEMTRAVSHEFRTPIVKMGYHVELLECDLPKDDFSILGIKQNMKELHSLVDELLLYSSLEQGFQVRFEEFDIKHAVENLIEQLHTINQCKLNLMMSEQFIIKAHEGYLVRALQNLITNAQRYAQNQINIYVEQIGSHVHIRVEDDGPGLTNEQKQTVFEPFTVIEKSRNKKLAGHGLGLAIVKRIVLFHGGKAFVDEPKQLTGASFVMVFPKRAI